MSSVHTLLEGEPENLKRVLIVETDLPTMDGRDSRYDEQATNEIIRRASDFMGQKGSDMIADELRIMPE